VTAQRRLNPERAMLDEVSLDVSISRRLGDELIAASREVVDAWHTARHRRNMRAVRMRVAIEQLERLVGRPTEDT
jgi:hypothetical protein